MANSDTKTQPWHTDRIVCIQYTDYNVALSFGRRDADAREGS